MNNPPSPINSQASGKSPAFVRVEGSDWGVVAALVALTAVAYWPLQYAGFINFDDPDYVTTNLTVQRGLTWQGVEWAFTTGFIANWHPLTWLSHMLDCSIFGLNPSGPHIESVALHTLNAALLFWLLRRSTGARWISALVATLFALHPAHVESVAWLSERKDLLSTLFWLLTSLAYLRWVEVPNKIRYAGIAVLLALGLMCKPMLVTLPFTLILLDYWPLRRLGPEAAADRRISLGHAFIEKIPLFGIVTVSSIVTFVAQHQGGAVASITRLSLTSRLSNAAVSYARYLGEFVWPSRLGVYYPLTVSWPILWIVGAFTLLSAISAGAWLLRSRRPYFVTGWLFFVGTLVPVIGVVQVGNQSIADRYTYVPFIGLFIAVAWALRDLAPRVDRRRIALILPCVAALSALLVATRSQASVWIDNETLFRHTLAVSRVFNEYAHYEIGVEALKRNDLAEAKLHFRSILRVFPKNALGNAGLGTVLAQQGKMDEAATHFEAALREKPNHPDSHRSLGVILAEKGRIDDALFHFKEAARLEPTDAVSRSWAGRILAKQGDGPGAIGYLDEAVRLAPKDNSARLLLIKTLVQQHHSDQAIVHMKQLRRLVNDDRASLGKIGATYASIGLSDDAKEAFERSLQIDSRDPSVHVALADVLLSRGQKTEALAHYQDALRILPGDRELLMKIGTSLANHDNMTEALPFLLGAVEVDLSMVPRYLDLARENVRRQKQDNAAILLRELSALSARWRIDGKTEQSVRVDLATKAVAAELGIPGGVGK